MKKIVAELSVTEQVLNLPLNSVVLVRYDGVYENILHRTGTNGWLTTRGLNDYGHGTRYYANNNEIGSWLSDKESNVYLLTDNVEE